MNDKPALLFILGKPKSGTTFLSNILNAHPQIYLRIERLNSFYREAGKGPGAEEAVRHSFLNYLEQLREEHPAKLFVGDKIILTAREMDSWAPFFFDSRNKVIGLTRDPRDQIVSSRFHRANRATTGVAPGEDPWWALNNAWQEKWVKILSDQGACMIAYEDLYRSPGKSLKKIFDYLGLPWNETQAASMIRRARDPRFLDYGINPLRDGRPGAWRKHLLPDECLKIKKNFKNLDSQPEWEFETLGMLRFPYFLNFLFLRFPGLKSPLFWRWVRRHKNDGPLWLSRWWRKVLDYEDPLMQEKYYALRRLPLPASWLRYLVRNIKTPRTSFKKIKEEILLRLLRWAEKRNKTWLPGVRSGLS